MICPLMSKAVYKEQYNDIDLHPVECREKECALWVVQKRITEDSTGFTIVKIPGHCGLRRLE